jgi:hypothetical protein
LNQPDPPKQVEAGLGRGRAIGLSASFRRSVTDAAISIL